MRYPIFNTYVDALSFDETIEQVEKIILKRKPAQHVVLNALKVNLMQDDEGLTKIVNGCALINADGASILWAAKKFNMPITERVTGIDLFIKLVELSEKNNWRIFLLGAKEEVVRKVNEMYAKRYPDLQIAGYRNGYFEEKDNPEIVKQIADSKPDILFVAFSSPKKEYWINENISKLNVPFVMGVGGSFDVVAGETRRAPLWMQKSGLEWFYRFIQEPRRMWRRYIVGNVSFMLLVFRTMRMGNGK